MPIGTQDFEYVLDNEFFKNIEGEDVQKGKVKVKLTVKRTAASFELDFYSNSVRSLFGRYGP